MKKQPFVFKNIHPHPTKKFWSKMTHRNGKNPCPEGEVFFFCIRNRLIFYFRWNPLIFCCFPQMLAPCLVVGSINKNTKKNTSSRLRGGKKNQQFALRLTTTEKRKGMGVWSMRRCCKMQSANVCLWKPRTLEQSHWWPTSCGNSAILSIFCDAWVIL